MRARRRGAGTPSSRSRARRPYIATPDGDCWRHVGSQRRARHLGLGRRARRHHRRPGGARRAAGAGGGLGRRAARARRARARRAPRPARLPRPRAAGRDPDSDATSSPAEARHARSSGDEETHWHPTSASATSRSRASRRAATRRPARSTFVIQKHAATPPALRLPPRARRHAEELGGAEGAEPRPGRQAHGGARRGPSDRLRRLRGNDPEGPVRRRRGDRLGQRHLGAGRRPARRLPRRQAQVPAATARSCTAAGRWCACTAAPASARSRGC